MKEQFELTEFFPVSPKVLYSAWLDSTEHTIMTGGEAQCGDLEGSGFTAWDGYIYGKNLKLTSGKKIIQSWRTSEFDDGDEDSLLTVKLEEVDGGCQLTLIHTHIPPGQTQYKQGWIDHYFTPMKAYFEKG